MPLEKKSHIILSVFFMCNEGKFEDLKLSEKEIFSVFNQSLSDSDIRYYIQQNIGDGLLVMDVVVDDPEINGIFYSLTKKGIDKIRQIFDLEFEEELPEELIQFQSLYVLLLASNLPESEKEAYDNTILEIIRCYKNGCLNAAISLCGKLLEIYLTELLVRNNIEIKWFQKGPKDTEGSFTEELTLGQLFILAKTRLADEIKLASLDENQIQLIKNYRNGMTHYNKSGIIPTKEIAMGIMQFSAHFLRHRLSWS